MYKKKPKVIPSILGIALITAIMGSLFYFDNKASKTSVRADQDSTPANITLSNISDSSITVAWQSVNKTPGAIILESPSGNKYYFDDRDKTTDVKSRHTHSITLDNLTENTLYKIKVLPDQNNKCKDSSVCPNLSQMTPPKLKEALDVPPVSGNITTQNGQIPQEAIVVLRNDRIANLSSYTDSSGSFVIPLHNMRSNDLYTRPNLSNSDLFYLKAYINGSQTAETVITLQDIIDRKKIYLKEMLSTADSYNNAFPKNTEDKIMGSQNIKKENLNYPVDILFPIKDGDITVDPKPRIRGTGQAGSTVIVTVRSKPQTARIQVGNDGLWEYIPEYELEPGLHNILIEGFDEKGNMVKLKKSFYVIKDGERVLGDSTPAATITTAPSPTSSLSPSPTMSEPSPTTLVYSPTPPLPSPTQLPTQIITREPPRTGSNTPFGVITVVGMASLILGGWFIIANRLS